MNDGRLQNKVMMYHGDRLPKPTLVYVISHDYLNDGRFSNFVTFCRVRKDGTINRTRQYGDYDYGKRNWSPAKGYRVETRVVKGTDDAKSEM